jgi:hypothetical protein
MQKINRIEKCTNELTKTNETVTKQDEAVEDGMKYYRNMGDINEIEIQ